MHPGVMLSLSKDRDVVRSIYREMRFAPATDWLSEVMYRSMSPPSWANAFAGHVAPQPGQRICWACRPPAGPTHLLGILTENATQSAQGLSERWRWPLALGVGRCSTWHGADDMEVMLVEADGRCNTAIVSDFAKADCEREC
jgi:hypothetical protein